MGFIAEPPSQRLVHFPPHVTGIVVATGGLVSSHR